MSRNLWIGLVVVLVIGLAGWYLMRPKQEVIPTPSVDSMTPSTDTANPSASSSAMMNEVIVNISSTGFSPNDITIKVGESVTWMNVDNAMHNVSSAPHPIHTTYTPLNLGSFAAGEKVSLVFDKAGTYKYHDHLNPSIFGSITVQ